jgi:hypothetical protein
MDARVSHDLDLARRSGFRGGFISNHRALLFSPLDRGKLLQAAVMMTALVAAWYLLLPLVSRFWGTAMLTAAEALRLVGAVNRPEHYSVAGLIHIEVPALYVPAGLPPRWAWELGAGLAAVLMAISFVLPERSLPLSYLLRLVALVQVVAEIYFALWPNDFPYTAGGYIQTMVLASAVFIWLIPVVLALTYYLFDFTLTQKLRLTVIVMGHQAVMVPLQYVVHALVLYHLSLLFLPVLFFVLSLPLNVFALVAFYGWGFSWPSPLRDRQVQGRIRVRTAERHSA